jgi:hypothetical protein
MGYEDFLLIDQNLELNDKLTRGNYWLLEGTA